MTPSISAIATSDIDPGAALDALADSLFEAEIRDSAALRRPGATYRLQLHKGFRLEDAARIVDYLGGLGITDYYLSPYLQARPGSTHGYDVFDHGRINPEIGDEDDHARLVSRLRDQGMGRVLDIVPNHMGIGARNPFWLDVLETGPQAKSARFFDIDWHPVKEELEGRVLLPILEDQYGKVLEAGKLTLGRDGGAFFIQYGDYHLPLTPWSYTLVLARRENELGQRFDPDDDHLLEYRSIWASARNLAVRDVTDRDRVPHMLREKTVIKLRLRRLCEERPDFAEFIDANVAEFRGTAGDPRSFDLLHSLLEQQIYRLANWRVAAEEINYRRFFDINDLAGLRTEDRHVFDVVHALIFDWIDRGGVTGLRIDHPDGLADPLGYFRRLQEALFLRACRRRFEAEPNRSDDWPRIAERLQERYQRVLEAEPSSPLARRFPVVAEKILSRREELPTDWPIDGTVGYEYLNALNGLFVDSTATKMMGATYSDFTGDVTPFADVLYEAKQLIARAALSSEVNMLARMLNRASEHDRRTRDFTLNDLSKALREVIACFPVYRTYLRPGQPIATGDRYYIKQAVARARGKNPAIDATVFTFLREVLLLEHPEGITQEDRAQREAFVVRFQQTTGPIQAKGLEDTAFYRQVKLASLNEVGADPSRFGNSPAIFHALNAQRLKDWPGALGTTATHDTKRGEDARIRIDALSEVSGDWKQHLFRWRELNRHVKARLSEANAREAWEQLRSRRKGKVSEVDPREVLRRWRRRQRSRLRKADAPDAREEYLLYQTLIGAWPFGGPDDAPPPGFVGRIQQYMDKALREAKLNTSWTDTDPTYTETVARFVAEILQGPDAGVFLKDFLPFQRRVARIGIVHSLAQTLLKLASPGVPDIYQGSELWDLNLVDPDNRRPIDFELRSRLLDGLNDALSAGETRAELATRLLSAPEDGTIKLYVIWTVLNHRKANPDLYQQGAYRPLEADGDQKANVVAFARHREGRAVLAIAPRLVAGLMGEDSKTMPIGREVWAQTRLVLPDVPVPRRWRNLLTGETTDVREHDGHPTLDLADVFKVLPVALLVGESSQA